MPETPYSFWFAELPVRERKAEKIVFTLPCKGDYIDPLTALETVCPLWCPHHDAFKYFRKRFRLYPHQDLLAPQVVFPDHPSPEDIRIAALPHRVQEIEPAALGQ